MRQSFYFKLNLLFIMNCLLAVLFYKINVASLFMEILFLRIIYKNLKEYCSKQQ